MQYIKKDLGSYNLHIIKTNKYKTVTLKVIFHSPIVKDEITIRNVLQDILLQSTKNYSTKRDMIIESEDLYAAEIYNNTQRWGNYVITSLTLQILNDKYTEEDNMKKSIEFLHEILFNPDVKDNKFKKDKLSLVKNNCEVTLSTLKENPREYASIRLRESYDDESPLSYRMLGYKEDLKKINCNNLYEYYEKLIDKDFVDIFVVGNINPDEITMLIKDNFKFRKIKKHKTSYELDNKKQKTKRLVVKEKVDNSQSIIGIACPLKKMSDFDKKYPLVLANLIFGGGSDSKLFKEVRENNSLCYTIYSSLSKLDNLITINAGINKDNYDKTVTTISKVLEDLKKGKFTEKDISIAKQIYINAINSIEENPNNLITEYFTENITGLENYKDRIEIMNKITKKDIIRAFKKINIDTVFLLEGDMHEND